MTAVAARARAVAAVTGLVRVFDPAEEDLIGRFRPSRFQDLPAGRLAIVARPDTRRAGWIAQDLLTALGVSRTASGAGRNAHEDWLVLPTWLVTDGITDIAVHHAERLDPLVLEPLVLLAAQVGARLWLLEQLPRIDRHVRYLDAWNPDEVSWEDFRGLRADTVELFPPRGRAAGSDDAPLEDTAAAAPGPPSTLPAADFLLLRATCRDLLPTAQWSWVDAYLTAAVADARAWGSGHREDLVSGDGLELLGQYLYERYDTCASTAEWVLQVRAMQIALFGLGLFLQADIDQLCGLAPRVPTRAQRTAATWDRLRIYRQPHRGATVALAALGFGLDDVRAMSIGAVSEDGAVVTVEGEDRAVEPGAARYLAAQRLLRLADGAASDDLLITGLAGAALTPKGAALIVRHARLEAGVLVSSRQIDRRTPNGSTWVSQWGLSLQVLS